MAANYREHRFYPVHIDYFVQKARQMNLAGLKKYRYVSDVPIQNGVLVRVSKDVSLASWGEYMQISMTWTPEGTHLDIVSECAMPTQIIDWGANKKNVQALFNYFETGMPR